MNFFSKLKKKLKKEDSDKPRKPAMDESDNPNASEAATSFVKMLAGDKKKKKEKSGY